MTSELKIEAYRLNAKRSTGPKTKIGKAKSSRNACQHGLSLSNFEDDASASPWLIATRGALEQGSLDLDDLVRANFRLGRIRQARYELLVALLECPNPKLAKRLARLERYERPARAAQRRFLRSRLK